MQPWLFCLTHMVAEGVIPESANGTLMRMFSLIERKTVHNRIFDIGDEATQLFAPDVGGVDGEPRVRKRSLRTILLVPGKHRGKLQKCAGAWFPYCAKSRSTVAMGWGWTRNRSPP